MSHAINPVRALAAGASTVTVALTGAAFWLSYEHLHEIADANGLDGARAWAWPGTIDAFIVVGELLILRAALRSRFDWFAYLLAAVGSVGSIALNVAGVGWGASTLEYVTAAVPPVAALLAFAAVMRQVHERLAEAPQSAEARTPVPGVEQGAAPAQGAPQGLPEVRTERPAVAPAPVASPLVVCGADRVWELDAPAAEVRTEPELRLTSEVARAVIESAWKNDTPVAEAARLSTRSETRVRTVYRELEEARGAQQVPGQLSLVGTEVAS